MDKIQKKIKNVFCIQNLVVCIQNQIVCVQHQAVDVQNQVMCLKPCIFKTKLCVSKTKLCMSKTKLCVFRTKLCVFKTKLCMSKTKSCVSNTKLWMSNEARWNQHVDACRLLGCDAHSLHLRGTNSSGWSTDRHAEICNMTNVNNVFFFCLKLGVNHSWRTRPLKNSNRRGNGPHY
jgi:hypothetical protein